MAKQLEEFSILPKNVVETLLDIIGEVHSGILKMAARELDVPVEDYILKLIVEHVRELRDAQYSDIPEKALAALGEAKLPIRRGRTPGPVEGRKKAYLEACYSTGNLALALQTVRISMSLPYIWARSDPEFREKWNVARGYCGQREYVWPHSRVKGKKVSI